MDGFFSPSGAALISPALWLVVGFALATGMHFILFGLFRREDHLYFVFGIVCLVISLNAFLLAESISAATPEQTVWFHRHRLTVSLAFFVLLGWFVALYTHDPHPRRWLIAFGIPFGVLISVNLLSSNPLGLAEMEVSAIRLPWGETVNRVHGRLVGWLPYAFLPLYALIGWASWRCVAQFRRGERGAAVALGVFLFALIGAVIFRELIAFRGIAGVPIVDFAFVLLVAIMGVRLALVLRDRSQATETSVHQLRDEMERRRNAETRLRHLAYHDPLTELPNRAALAERLRESLTSSAGDRDRGALLMLDLDHFKIINDSLGHDVGDRLLQQVGTRLQKETRQGDVAVRMGGDEFAVLLTHLPPAEVQALTQARQTAERLTAALTAPFSIDQRELQVGVSIGVCLFEKSDDDREGEVIRKADTALYRAKTAGRNLIQVFTPDLQADVDRRLNIEKGLRRALSNEEFTLYFQPQTDRTGKLIGVEALLRWQSTGTEEQVSPAVFIPVAEETGLIHPIGDWVLNEACRRINAWRAVGFDGFGQLSVNVSAWQIGRVEFADHVKTMLSRHGTEARHLILEITESAVLNDPDIAIANMNALVEAGVELSIDDFGIGYSSLGYLQRLPLRYLKIDRSFVRDLAAAQRRRLARSIVHIGQQLGLRVIAEGVESPDQRESLIAMGVDGFQGNFVSPPLSEAQLIDWARRQRAS